LAADIPAMTADDDASLRAVLFDTTAGFVADAGGALVVVTIPWQAATGLAHGAGLAPGLAAAAHPDDRAVLAGLLAGLLAGPAAIDQRLRLAAGDGWRWWRLRATPRPGGGWAGTLVDIDAEQHALAALAASEERFAATMALSDLLPWRMTIETALVASPAGPAAEGDNDPIHPEDRARVLAERQRGFAGGRPIDHVYRLCGPDGVHAWWRARAAPWRDGDGRIRRWYGTLENVDAATRADLQLRRLRDEMIIVARRNAMGEIASTLAHELNQPLAAALNYLRGCEALLAGGDVAVVPDLSEAIASAALATERAGSIVRRLRALVSQGPEARAPASVAVLVAEACSLALLDAGGLQIEAAQTVAADAGDVDCNRLQIEQVIINLVRNAVEALRDWPGPRRIGITAERVDDGVSISVSDSGPGVAAGVVAGLFEPLRSTKAEGSGLGLSICRTIIEAHGGRICHAPAPGGGACFTLVLPGTV
jgi:signal transduction histidine kinase